MFDRAPWPRKLLLIAGILAITAASFIPTTVAASGSTESRPLLSTRMIDSRNGWATGQSGQVLRTEDGGSTWRDVSPTSLPAADAAAGVTVPFFLRGDAQAAWLLDTRDETVYRTVDGGAHWSKGTPPAPTVANDGGSEITFISRQQGWLLVSGGAHDQAGELFKTTDGGRTWQAISSTDLPGGLPFGGQISFSPAVNGLGWLRPNREAKAAGTPPLYVTTDGGETWAPQQLTFGYQSYSSDQVYAQLPQFAGEFGVMPVTLLGGKADSARFFTTRDGGRTWSLAGGIDDVGSSVELMTSVVDAKASWCYVPDGNILWSTRDGGRTWSATNPEPSLYSPQSDASAAQVTQLDFFSATEGWAVVNGALLHTQDSGRTWWAPASAVRNAAIAPVGGVLPEPPSTSHMFSSKDGYGSSPAHPVAITHNGGATWSDATPRDVHVAQGDIVQGYFTDSLTGWAFSLRPGMTMTVYGTRNGGKTWTKLSTVPVKYGDGNMSVTFADAKRGWFEDLTAGMGQLTGEIYATTDGGKTWTKVADTQLANSASFGGQLTAQRNGTLWLSGAQRASEGRGGPGFIWLFKSRDAGRTWAQVKLPVPTAYKKAATSVSQPVFFGNSGLVTVLYTGGKAVVYSSKDGGKTWAARGKAPAGSWPVFADAMNGWQTDGQHVYRTRDGGRTWQTLTTSQTLRKTLSGRYIAQLNFVDAKHGWAVLQGKQPNIKTALLSTNDGGKTWKK